MFEQLTDKCQLQDNTIIFSETCDRQALEFAASLNNIGYYFAGQPHSFLRPEQDPKWHDITAHSDDLAVWVGCLAAYNHGYLHGLWIGIEQDAESIRDDIEFMLSWSPVRHLEECEEWDIFDTSDCFEPENDPDYLSEIGMAYQEHGEAYLAYLSVFSYAPSVEDFQNRYHGEYKSELDYTYEYVESTGMLDSCPDTLQRYFDYESFKRDLFICDLDFIDGFVFSNH